MQLPEGLVQYKVEFILTYVVSVVLAVTEILGDVGKLIGILSTIAITIALLRMYKSQRLLNETQAEIELEKLKALKAGKPIEE